jgi:hypothetical protein
MLSPIEGKVGKEKKRERNPFNKFITGCVEHMVTRNVLYQHWQPILMSTRMEHFIVNFFIHVETDMLT